MFADSQKDVVFSLRTLLKYPGFTAVAVLTLALGIGAVTAIFSVVNAVLLAPLPYDEPDRLVGVWSSAPALREELLPQSAAVHFTYEDESRVIEDIGLFRNVRETVLGLEEPMQVACALLTDGTLRALRVQPVLGRLFSREDISPGSPRTVILSYSYWQSQFGGNDLAFFLELPHEFRAIHSLEAGGLANLDDGLRSLALDAHQVAQNGLFRVFIRPSVSSLRFMNPA